MIVFLVVLVVLVAAFGYSYVQSSNTIASLNQTVSSQSSHIGILDAQIATDESRISTLNSTVASLNSQVTVDEARISSLTAKDAQANATIATLNSQISTLNGQIATLTTQISALQTQVASLDAIANLSQSTVVTTSQSFTTGSNGQVQIAYFPALYAGYVTITVSAASDFANEGVGAKIIFSANVNSPNYGVMYIPYQNYFYAFGSTSDTLVIPVIPGQVTLYLETSDLTAQTATLTVTYYS